MLTNLRVLWSRFSGLFRRRRFEAEMVEEMRAHLEVLVEEYIAAGMTAAEARCAARKRFGGVAQIEECCRRQHRFAWVDQVAKDTLFSIRSLARARSYSVNVLAMLVVGIGIATLGFHLTSGILFLSEPFRDPERLYLLGFKNKSGTTVPYLSAVQFQAYREQTKAFSESAAVKRDSENVVVDGAPEVAVILGTTIDCFRMLGIKPVLGREFLPEEYRTGAEPVAIITDLFWRRYFHSTPDVLGRRLIIDQQPYTVVGVLAPNQVFPVTFEGDVFRPVDLKVDPRVPILPIVNAVARLAPGVSPEQAKAALKTVRLPPLPPYAAAYFAEQEPMLLKRSDLFQKEAFWVMAGASALLYGIACVNAMNLALLRLLNRHRELSIRMALGGSRWQIARLTIIESLGLALVAGALVAALDRWIFPHLLAAIYKTDVDKIAPTLSAVSVECIVVVTLAAALAVALIPLCRLRGREINLGLKDGGAAGEGRAMARARSWLVAGQAALALILLAGTGLMVRSFGRLYRTELGFSPTGRVTVSVSLPRGRELKPEAWLQLLERLRERLAHLPGVRHASYGQNSFLLGPSAVSAQVLMRDGTYQSAFGSLVAPDFLKTAGVVLKRGRWLSGKRGGNETLISETMAKALFGDADPIGRSFRLLVSDKYAYLVVGVVADVTQSFKERPGLQFYMPAWRFPPNVNTLLIQLGTDPPKEFEGTVRRAIYETDPSLIVDWVQTVRGMIGRMVWAEDEAFKVLKLLAGAALGLVMVGLFSVVSYSVECRMREFGVRFALGARPAAIHRVVLLRGLLPMAIGVGIGLGGAAALTRFIQSMLFETEPYDPLVYAAVAGLLMLAGVAACWLPARRAARVDVTTLLRTE